MNEKKNATIKYAVFLCLVVTTFLLIRTFAYTTYIEVSNPAELTDIDLSRGLVSLDASCFSRYPDRLYSPEDFAAGIVPPAEGNAADEVSDNIKTEVGTYRLELNLTPGVVYGLSGYSAAYAQTIWIDGDIMSEVGIPGPDAANTVSRANYFTVYFEAREPSTEIIWQRANFVHADEGKLPPLFFGTQQIIGDMLVKSQTWSVVMIGVMLAAFLIYIGFFLFSEKQAHFLWFALACFCIAARTFIREHKLIMVAFPDMLFATFHRLEYVVTNGFIVCLFLYIRRLFGIKGYVTWATVAISLLYLAIVMLTPSIYYTQLLDFMQVGFLLSAAVNVVLIVRSLFARNRDQYIEYSMIIMGILVCLVLAAVDVVRHSYGGAVSDLNLIQIGMLVFVMSNALALALGYRLAETERDKTNMALEQEREASRTLERLNTVKSDFLATVSHEMKTPLTIMSGFAQVTQYQLDAGASGDDVRRYLATVSDEAQRLSRLVIQLMNTTFERETPLDRMPIQPEDICQQLLLTCEPILTRHGNILRLEVEEDCPPVYANTDMLVQVLLNLITNASRHTRSDTIRLAAARDGAMVRFSVLDHGEGIDSQTLLSVFERGKSRDGSSGIGLSVCKEIIEGFGGGIWVESVPGEGASVFFTLPISQEKS